MIATISWAMAIPAAPIIMSGRRPTLSDAHMPIGVVPVLTTFVAIVMRKGLLIPALVKKVVP